MDLNSDTLVSAVGGAGGAGALLLWFLKRTLTKMEDSLDSLKKEVIDLKLGIAEFKGKEKGDSDLVWREINTVKTFRVKTESELQKMWGILSRFANPRVSDALTKALEEADK
jgi:hypothetical protein